MTTHKGKRKGDKMITLSNPKIIEIKENARYSRDERFKADKFIISLTGSDGNEYRKAIYTKEPLPIFPPDGSNHADWRKAERQF